MLKRFRTSEDGAVTVDWVVLTAVVVGLVAAGTLAVTDGTGDLAERVGSYLASITVG
ncbi:hypothetical protein [Leisingera aquaemixtae]|uniref:hypothetical protein n=1 Tax=Leisingera aquaemixtae TaxID=1396826 RepID=UPI0021BD655D|nr:hypothetical protein [Leisingera aquaemixtae]